MDSKWQKVILIILLITPTILSDITTIANTSELLPAAEEQLPTTSSDNSEASTSEVSPSSSDNSEASTSEVSPSSSDNSEASTSEVSPSSSDNSEASTSSSLQNNAQEKNIASGRFGSSDWTIDDSGCLHIGEGTFIENVAKSPWYDWRTQITSIVFEGRVILDENSNFLFDNLYKVREISDLSNVDTSKVKDFSAMFRSMTSLEKLDLENFDTSKAEDMYAMFASSSSLKELNLSSFDTSKVTNMGYMFYGMYTLRSLNLSSVDTYNTNFMEGMFNDDYNLSQLTLGKRFYFKKGVTLPPVPITDKYTGKWINVASGTVDKPNGKKIWTSEEFIQYYNNSEVGDTFVWQKKSFFITESYYDTEGESLKAPVVTEVDGKIFTPQPEKYEEVNDTLYIYKGWTEEQPESGTSIHGDPPPSTTVEMTYYYVYEKADKFINVTIPTEIVFGTEEHSKNITSKNYDIKNNSNDVDLQMTLATFDKVNSDIQLLDEATPDPSGKENSARLDLLVGGKTALSSLNEKVSEQELGNIQSGNTTTLALTGTYFGDLSERHKVEYKTNLKFKAQAKVKN